MARRSARLQKRISTPRSSTSTDASWATAEDDNTQLQLTSMVEDTEPEAAMKTPKKVASKKGGKPVAKKVEPEPAMQEPEAAATAATTSYKADETPSTARTASAATPKDRTPIKPADQEMHPALHHASTAKVLDEARWLGFQSLGAASAQPKATTGFGIGQATPSKSSIPAETPRKTGWLSSPGFEFSFKSPMAALSPAAARILRDGEEKAGATPGRALFRADEFTAPVDLPAVDMSPRRMAVPKGKSGRFSEAHRAQFERMDSIANHPSAFRADPTRFTALGTAVKRSTSKPDLAKPEETTKTPNKLKRTQSKMDLTEGQMRPPPAKPAATPLKRTNSKMDLPRSALRMPPVQSTSRMAPPAGSSPAKRVKRTEADDVGSTRPAEETDDNAKPQTPARLGLPRPTSRLLSPTKSSLMRSQSVKTTKTTSMIPSLFRSPSTKNLAAPSTIGDSMREGMREGIRKTSASLQKMKSILRTPNKKYSDDPAKLAAGTHMSPPPTMDFFGEPQPHVPPATAPVQKRVNFSASTLARVAQDELGKSPSPVKLRAGPDVGTGTVLYPRLQSADIEEPQVGSPVRRLTFGEAPSDAPPAEFSFTAEKTIKFGTPSRPSTSIRMVTPGRAASAVAGVDAKKRKLAPTIEEASDKENTTPPANADDEHEGRSPKKARMMSTPVQKTPAKMPASASKLPRRTPGRAGGAGASISKSRLAFLSTPKRTRI